MDIPDEFQKEMLDLYHIYDKGNILIPIRAAGCDG